MRRSERFIPGQGNQESPINAPAARVIDFVLRNCPERRFLLRMAQTGHASPFTIGQQHYLLRVANHGDLRYIGVETTDPKTAKPTYFGIVTDRRIKNIVGFSNQEIDLRLDPISFERVFHVVRRRIARSLQQTHDVNRTAARQGVRKEFVVRVKKKLHPSKKRTG